MTEEKATTKVCIMHMSVAPQSLSMQNCIASDCSGSEWQINQSSECFTIEVPMLQYLTGALIVNS
jgi:hypothetical protein